MDRLKTEEGGSFSPDVLLGDGAVTVKVLAHERGPKIRIGKYRKRTGYKRHNGFRAATSRVQVSLAAGTKAAPAKKAAPSKEAAAPKQAVAASREAAAPKVPEAAVEDHVKGMPSGYEELTVAKIAEGAKAWNRPMLEAALEYERAHAARKGAISALESALKSKEN